MATILIADDEEAIRILVSQVLTSAGHQVLAAANGFERSLSSVPFLQ
jgi:CheY-like chemotaxis protein